MSLKDYLISLHKSENSTSVDGMNIFFKNFTPSCLRLVMLLKKTITSLTAGKACGPDGFPSEVYQTFNEFLHL